MTVPHIDRLAFALCLLDGLLHLAEAFLGHFRVAAVRCTGQRDHMRLLRCRLDERSEIAARLVLRVRFDRLAGGHHEHHCPRRPVLLHADGGDERDDGEQIDADMAVPNAFDHLADACVDGPCHEQDDDPFAHTRVKCGVNVAPRAPLRNEGQRYGRQNGERKERNFLAKIDDFLHRISLRRYRLPHLPAVAHAGEES